MSASNKKVIITADDFGLSEEKNSAILEGLNRAQNGALSGTCICVNGEFFALPPQGELGVHLNIIEGKSLTQHKLLTRNGVFHHSWVSLFLNSYNKEFLNEVEKEFRAQIECMLNTTDKAGIEVKHINSHVHTHAIPNIFEITARLAAEYKIPNIRTQAEKLYFSHSRTPKPINLVKVAILNYFTIINRRMVKKYNLQTNDYVLGVGYTGEMDENTVLDGLGALSDFKNITVKVIIHPSLNNQEHALCANSELLEKIKNLGYDC